MAVDNYLVGTGWGGASMNYAWSTGMSPTESDDAFWIINTIMSLNLQPPHNLGGLTCGFPKPMLIQR